jgi:hypothetical protein
MARQPASLGPSRKRLLRASRPYSSAAPARLRLPQPTVPHSHGHAAVLEPPDELPPPRFPPHPGSLFLLGGGGGDAPAAAPLCGSPRGRDGAGRRHAAGARRGRHLGSPRRGEMRRALSRRRGPPLSGGSSGEDARAAPVQGGRRRAAREGRGRVRRGHVDQGVMLYFCCSRCPCASTRSLCHLFAYFMFLIFY